MQPLQKKIVMLSRVQYLYHDNGFKWPQKIATSLLYFLYTLRAPRYRFNIGYRMSNTMKRTNIDNIVFLPISDHYSTIYRLYRFDRLHSCRIFAICVLGLLGFISAFYGLFRDFLGLPRPIFGLLGSISGLSVAFWPDSWLLGSHFGIFLGFPGQCVAFWGLLWAIWALFYGV